MRVVSWNVGWCCGVDGVVSVSRVLEAARALADFDVLCLQEVAAGYPSLRGGADDDQSAQLRALLRGFRIFFAPGVDEFDRRGTHRRFGNLLATRLPVASVAQHMLPWPPDPRVPSMPRTCIEVTLKLPLGAVRVMNTQLEPHSPTQRLAQAHTLRELHMHACGRAAAPPASDAEAGTPYSAKRHTPHAILCGDFGADAASAECALLQTPFDVEAGPAAVLFIDSDSLWPVQGGAPPTFGDTRRLIECWPLTNGDAPRPPTAGVHGSAQDGESRSPDLVFVSDTLAQRVSRVRVDGATRAARHQPVLVEVSTDA